MYDIAVVGAGASGLAAAISAKRENPSVKVVLIEALPRVGKKILATGNGRCNLTNLNIKKGEYSNASFASFALKEYPPKKVIEIFESIGLMCTQDFEGRVYPMSNTAASVLECLRLEVYRLGIDIMVDTPVRSIKKNGDVFIINNSVKSKKVIVSGGGKSSPAQGSDGSCYPLLRSFGHKITELYPGLVQLTVKETDVKSMKGVRVKASINLFVNSELAAHSEGEVLFTDYGISGIAVMDISRTASKFGGLCRIDLLPKLSGNEVSDFLSGRKNISPNGEIQNALTGLLPSAVGRAVLKRVNILPNTAMSKLTDNDLRRISRTLKDFRLTVTGTKGFTNAQITVGGADVSEFNAKTMESFKVKGLYCTGEVLDVDAVCGGYNLQWAWASGLLAGKSAAMKIV